MSLSLSQFSRIARRQKCFLCDLPKSSWTILNDFSQPVCRGCVNYEGLDRVEDAISESRRLRELEGNGLAATSVTATCGVQCASTVTPSLTTCAPLDSTTLPQVDSSNPRHPGAGPRFDPATPQSTDAVDFLGAPDLPGMPPNGLPANSIVGSSAGNVVTNPAAATAARADSSGPGGFDDFPSPMTPYSPDWTGRTSAYGGALRAMDTPAYGHYNPLVTPDYMRPNPYNGYLAAHDSAFTYYGGWRAMKRSGPDDTLFSSYPPSNRPGSVPPRRMSEPSPVAKRMDRGSTVPKSPGGAATLSAGGSGSTQRPFDLTATAAAAGAADNVITIPSSPVAKPKEKVGDHRTAASSGGMADKPAAGDSTSTATSALSGSKDDAGSSSTVSTAGREKTATATVKATASSSPDSNTSSAKADSASASTGTAEVADSNAAKTKTDADASKQKGTAAVVTAASGVTAGSEAAAESTSSASSSAGSGKNTSKPTTQTSTTPAVNGSGDAPAPQKSCNHCGCGLSSVQYVQCPSVERHRYCLFCTYMHIEWSDPGAVSCPSKQRCLHPTSNVPWVFLPNEIESIRKAVQLSETPAIIQ